MGKFTVGQTVKVRKDLVVGEMYGYYFNDAMEMFKGKKVKITHIVGDRISIGEDLPWSWSWSEEMFEEIEPLFPTAVLELGQTAKLEIHVDRVIVNDPATIMFYRTANFDSETGQFSSWGEVKKIVSKVNKDIGDKYDVGKGVDVAILKAFRKEIDKQLRKF